MFLDSLDIANKVCQHCGVTQIASPTEDSKNCQEITFAYDKDRRAELQRNTWTFAVRNVALRPVDVDTMELAPAAYSASVTYLPGAIVADANRQLWYSRRKDNLNNSPGGNNDAWDMYFGPLTIYPYDSTTTYWAGELVYVAGSYPGSFNIFMSLINANADSPSTATAWSATTTYHSDMIVSYAGSNYKSTAEVNLNITPFDGSIYLPFDIGATYASGNEVTGSDNQLYTSVENGNIGHDPTTDASVHWTATGQTNAWTKVAATVTTSSANWQPITADMHNLTFQYPIGSGPASQMGTRNVYRLPAGFLKVAPQDPKAGSMSFLGAPSGLQYSQWNYAGNFIVSGGSDLSPIIFRFVADVTKVTDMHDMFCEGLAARIATSVCESLTQSTAKLQNIASAYKLFMGEARTVNAIEAGPVEPPEDDYITCRL